MANINVDLLTYNGQIGPQYYDQQANEMRPITREVLREMIVTNFPKVMDTSDQEAQNKLDNIITKLEGTLETQLTGSNVAVPVDLQYHDLEDNPLPIKEKPSIDVLYSSDTASENISIEPNGSYTLLVDEERLEYKKIIVVLRSVDSFDSWDVSLNHYNAAGYRLYTDTQSGGNELKAVFDNLTNRYDVVLHNKTDSSNDRILQRFAIVGVR